jgi:hypothetical protein
MPPPNGLHFIAERTADSDKRKFGGAVKTASNTSIPAPDTTYKGNNAAPAGPHVGKDGAGDGKLTKDIDIKLLPSISVTAKSITECHFT